MKQRPRIYYSEVQKALMWERWRKGDTLHQIANLFDRNHGAIQGILIRRGGIAPPPRRRSPLALTMVEREEISRALVAGQSVRAIAQKLGRAPSTISREITRNGGASNYRAGKADQNAWDQAHRPKVCKLAENRTLARRATEKLQINWLPSRSRAG
jgi:transposase-like protein